MNKIKTSFLFFLLLTAGCSMKDKTEIVPEKNENPITKVSSVGDVVGKLVVGYQAWFGCYGDGSSYNTWKTWGGGGSTPPSSGSIGIEMWPDVREYTTLFQTGFTNLGNGQPAQLFSSYTDQTVDTHFKWMQQYGIDCAALQRFGSAFAADPRELNWRNSNATTVRTKAEKYGRKFFIEYDISGWTNFQTEIKSDWNNYMKTHTSSSAYAKQNGKPVLSIWGIGVSGRPGDVTSWTDVINWFKSQGCYVIIGVKKDWRTDSGNMEAYNAANMIQPWTVGSYNGTSGADGYVSEMVADFNYCNSLGQDFQPVIFPGFAWSNWHTGSPQNEIPRSHGDFLWRQFYNIRNNGLTNVKIAMFDELNEGTAILKVAENNSMKPTNQYFLTLDAEGVSCSSDFYLRMAGDGAKMVKGTTGLSTSHPTPHMNYLDHCDANTSWSSANTLSVYTSDRKEGTSCLQSVGSGTDEFKKSFSTPFNSCAAIATGYLTFWYYVSDVSKFGSSNQVELGSGGTSDVNEYNWNIGTLVNGWNYVVLKFSNAGVMGTPDLSDINWFRIYHAKTASITTMVDAIQITP